MEKKMSETTEDRMWIETDDRMPEANPDSYTGGTVEVLCRDNDGNVRVGHFIESRAGAAVSYSLDLGDFSASVYKSSESGAYPTHWMYLPSFEG